MTQNYNSLLSKLTYSLKTIFPSGNDILVNDVTSICQAKIKTDRANWLVFFLMLLALPFGQAAMAKNTSNQIFTSQKFIVSHILNSSFAEGRGGGGGHGNLDWVIGHPLDVGQMDLVSGNLNTNSHNII